MNFFVNAPVIISARIVGGWLNVGDVGRLEVAMCSMENRMAMMEINQNSLMSFDASARPRTAKIVLNWLIVRKIKVSSLVLTSGLPSNVNTMIISLIYSSSVNVTKVTVIRNDPLARAVLIGLGNHCPNLSSLRFEGCKLDGSIRSLLMHSQELAELELIDCTGLDVAFFVDVVCQKLTWLQLVGTFDHEQQTALLIMAPNLDGLYRSKGELHLTIDNRLKNLETVELIKCQVTFAGVSESTYYLRLSDCNITDDTVRDVVRTFPKLVNINISGNSLLSDEGVKAIADTYGKRLRTVKLVKCANVSGNAITDMCKKCTLINTLDVSRNLQFSSNISIKLIDALAYLRTLRLNGLQVSNNALACIARSRLRVVELNDTNGYDFESISNFFQSSRKLQKISMNHFLVNTLVTSLLKRYRSDLEFAPAKHVDYMD